MRRILLLACMATLVFAGCRTSENESQTRDLAIDAKPGGKFSVYKGVGLEGVGRYICLLLPGKITTDA